MLWQWKNDNPYGYNEANGSIEFNLRFAGQYYDSESGLHYNMFRTYNPEIGRYMQSDPIGLAGGFNTYNYVNKNPLDGFDNLGLDCVAKDGRVTCNVPHGPIISFPRPTGWPDTIKSSNLLYHYYNKWDNAKDTDSQCLTDYIKNNPTPGIPSPATYKGTPNNASPFVKGIYTGRFMSNPVISYLVPYGNSQIVINVTQPGHGLFPGYVVRQITNTKEGTIINNFGEGTGLKQARNNFLAEKYINNEWYGLNKEAINSCSCKK